MTDYIRIGTCEQCGECCKSQEIMITYMINTKGDACKYLDKEKGKHICLITAGIFNQETPTKPPEIPQEAYNYWLRECFPYPNPDDESHTPPRYALFAGCGYVMVVRPD